MKGRANYLCLHRLDQARASSRRRTARRDRRVGRHDRDRRSRRARRSARRQRPVERDLGHRGHLPGQRVPAVSAVLRHAHAPARRRVRRRHRQSPPALRRRRGAAELVRRSDPRLPASGARRGASARGCRHPVLRPGGEQLSRSTSSCATASGCSRPAVVADRDGDVQRAVGRVADHGRAFFGGLAMARRSAGAAAKSGCASAPTGSATSSTRAGAGDGARRPRGRHGARRRERSRARAGGQRGRADDRPPRAARCATISSSCSRPVGRGVRLFSSRLAAAACSCAPRRSTCRRSSRTSCSTACAPPCSPRRRSPSAARSTMSARRLGIDEAAELRVPSEFDFATPEPALPAPAHAAAQFAGFRRRRRAPGHGDPAGAPRDGRSCCSPATR